MKIVSMKILTEDLKKLRAMAVEMAVSVSELIRISVLKKGGCKHETRI